MSAADDIDIIALARQAKAAGIDTPVDIIEELEAMIRDNKDYLERPYRRGKPLRFNAVVEHRTKALAAAIVLIESLAANGDNEDNGGL